MDYGSLQTEIEKAMTNQGLPVCDKLATKTIQLYETLMVRFDVMLVGPTLGGKTTDYKCLGTAMTKLREQDHEEENYKKTMFACFNPNAISMGELYGSSTSSPRSGPMVWAARSCEASSRMRTPSRGSTTSGPSSTAPWTPSGLRA